MDRRKFLALIGAGAAGSAGTALTRRRDEGRGTGEGPPPQELEAASTGQQRITWSVETAARIAALTFDDGPDPAFTPRILEILDSHRVTATFFALGYNAARHPGLLQEVVAAGHEIGSHGWRHLSLVGASPEEARREIEHGTRLVEDHAGVAVRSFRPPYGRFDEITLRILAQQPQDMYVWSVTRGPLAWKDPARIAAHLKQEVRPGDIVDLHDGIGRGTFDRTAAFAQKLVRRRSVEVDALPRVLEEAAESGLRFTTVSELVRKARARG